MTIDEFFAGYEASKEIFEVVQRSIETTGPSELRVSKSQIAFRHGKVFARVWIPGQYLRGKTAPLVLTLSFRNRDESPRWKEIVEPTPGRFTHHLELHSIADIDDEVSGWLVDARAAAAS